MCQYMYQYMYRYILVPIRTMKPRVGRGRQSSSSSLKRLALAEKKDEHEEMATFAEIASEIVFEKCNGFGYD